MAINPVKIAGKTTAGSYYFYDPGKGVRRHYPTLKQARAAAKRAANREQWQVSIGKWGGESFVDVAGPDTGRYSDNVPTAAQVRAQVAKGSKSPLRHNPRSKAKSKAKPRYGVYVGDRLAYVSTAKADSDKAARKLRASGAKSIKGRMVGPNPVSGKIPAIGWRTQFKSVARQQLGPKALSAPGRTLKRTRKFGGQVRSAAGRAANPHVTYLVELKRADRTTSGSQWDTLAEAQEYVAGLRTKGSWRIVRMNDATHKSKVVARGIRKVNPPNPRRSARSALLGHASFSRTARLDKPVGLEVKKLARRGPDGGSISSVKVDRVLKGYVSKIMGAPSHEKHPWKSWSAIVGQGPARPGTVRSTHSTKDEAVRAIGGQRNSSKRNAHSRESFTVVKRGDKWHVYDRRTKRTVTRSGHNRRYEAEAQAALFNGAGLPTRRNAASMLLRRENPKRTLTVPQKHQLKIARATLRMNDAMVGVMGGPTKAEAREIIFRLTGKRAKANPKHKSSSAPSPTRMGYIVEVGKSKAIAWVGSTKAEALKVENALTASGRKAATYKAKLPSTVKDGLRKAHRGITRRVSKNPARLGSGGRFKACVASARKGGASDPAGVCAAAGRRKYGAKRMAKMAATGRKRAAAKQNPPRHFKYMVSSRGHTSYARMMRTALAKAKSIVRATGREAEVLERQGSASAGTVTYVPHTRVKPPSRAA